MNAVSFNGERKFSLQGEEIGRDKLTTIVVKFLKGLFTELLLLDISIRLKAFGCLEFNYAYSDFAQLIIPLEHFILEEQISVEKLQKNYLKVKFKYT